jgi:hypothetical protein
MQVHETPTHHRSDKRTTVIPRRAKPANNFSVAELNNSSWLQQAFPSESFEETPGAFEGVASNAKERNDCVCDPFGGGVLRHAELSSHWPIGNLPQWPNGHPRVLRYAEIIGLHKALTRRTSFKMRTGEDYVVDSHGDYTVTGFLP